MKIFFLFFILFSSNAVLAQENATHQVIYDYIAVISTKNHPSDSIVVPYIRGNDTTWKKIPKERSYSRKKLKLKVTVTANNDSAVIVIGPGRKKESILVPEKAVLKNKNWKVYANGMMTDLKPANVSVTATDSYKSILDYRCRKYKVVNNDKGSGFEIWVTDQLPPTFLPSSAYSPFAGAVLEMYFPGLNISFIAKTIKKLSF